MKIFCYYHSHINNKALKFINLSHSKNFKSKMEVVIKSTYNTYTIFIVYTNSGADYCLIFLVVIH